MSTTWHSMLAQRASSLYASLWVFCSVQKFPMHQSLQYSTNVQFMSIFLSPGCLHLAIIFQYFDSYSIDGQTKVKEG